MNSGRPITHINLSRGFRGGERQTELLLRELEGLGIAQRAVLRDGSALAQRLADVPGLECRTVRTPWLPRPDLLGPGPCHAHEARAAHLAHLTHALNGVPYLVTRRAWERPGDGFMTHRALRRAARVVAISGAVRDRLKAYDAALDPQIIPSACAPATPDPARVAELKSRWRGRFVVGHAGALVDRHKGQRVLIRAVARLREDVPDITLVLLGAGPDESLLREAAAGLDCVQFEGFVEDVENYLAAFDVFAFPSHYEALGSTLLDAMAAGLPAVASRVGGIPEVVEHDRTGLLVPPADPVALAGAIAALHRDPERRARLGARARTRAGAFSAAAMAQRYLALYRAAAPGVAA